LTPRAIAVLDSKTEMNYVDCLMEEWRAGEQPRRLQSCVRTILNELTAEALLVLKDPRLEVMILPDAPYSVWVYFPWRGPYSAHFQFMVRCFAANH
jgi:hypothetical protein